MKDLLPDRQQLDLETEIYYRELEAAYYESLKSKHEKQENKVLRNCNN